MNKENNRFIDEFNPFRLCREILQQWKRILAVAIIAAIVVFPLSLKRVTRTYQASFQMLVDIPGLFQKAEEEDSMANDISVSDYSDSSFIALDASSDSASQSGTPQKPSGKKGMTSLEAATMHLQNLTATYASLLSSNVVLQPVVESLEADLEYKDLRSNFSAEPMGTAPVITVTIWHDDAKVAEEIAMATTDLAPDILHNIAPEGTCTVIGKPLVEKYSSTASIVKSNTVQAAVLGAFLSILWICIRFLLNNYIEDDSDVKKYLDLPLVGVIPSVKEVQ